MYTELSFESLKIISDNLTLRNEEKLKNKLDNFLATKYDDYYVYGRKLSEEQTIEITTHELESIIASTDRVDISSAFDDLHSIYKNAIATSQNSIFLYGRNRI
ncbi:MAG: hypothetical protein HRU07_05655 [Nitrosopumilus sp.]|nr:hypothetical protein [Nitrosopumilus sp.]NRA05631.1 hypothetical protein [Nitrosopumilus sp.]